jgi:anti-sigma factor RsiW
MTCQLVEQLATLFVDGECPDADRAAIAAHLQNCRTCRQRVEAEATAREVLHAHASVARTMGVAPAWRPRVWRLGQPAIPVAAPALVVAIAVTSGLLAFALRAAPVVAVGVIGDSFCQHEHRPAARYGVGEDRCTRNCVAGGAQYVLVTETQIYKIQNQDLSDLSAFADARVAVQGRLEGDTLVVASLTRAE